MKDIIIFTKEGCLFCAMLKSELNRESISFCEIDAKKNKPIWDDVVKQTNIPLLPTVFIPLDDEGNGTVYSPGRDFHDSNEIFQIIKREIEKKRN